jgi:hypothetical protein
VTGTPNSSVALRDQCSLAAKTASYCDGSSDSTSSGWLITHSIQVALPRLGTNRRSPRSTTTTSSYSRASTDHSAAEQTSSPSRWP